jgi:hypothetical protein
MHDVLLCGTLQVTPDGQAYNSDDMYDGSGLQLVAQGSGSQGEGSDEEEEAASDASSDSGRVSSTLVALMLGINSNAASHHRVVLGMDPLTLDGCVCRMA